MFYLVGSRALEHYGVSLSREPGDYDIISDYTYKVDIHNRSVKLKDTEKGEIRKVNNSGEIIDIFDKNLWDTDKLFLSIRGEGKNFKFNNKAYMNVIVAPKEILYLMYRTSAEVYKDNKSVRDFEIVKAAWPDLMFRHELYEQRLKETQDYYNKTKKQFFEQHGLKQYIDHDKLHVMVTESYINAKPMYLSILDSKDSTKINIDNFNNLTLPSQVILLAEEIVVLMFERYFVYKTVTEGFREEYVKNFFNNGKLSILNKITSHVCEKGLKGEHPEIIEFAKNNISEIKARAKMIRRKLKDQPLPAWFLSELEIQRDKYIKDFLRRICI